MLSLLVCIIQNGGYVKGGLDNGSTSNICIHCDHSFHLTWVPFNNIVLTGKSMIYLTHFFKSAFCLPGNTATKIAKFMIISPGYITCINLYFNTNFLASPLINVRCPSTLIYYGCNVSVYGHQVTYWLDTWNGYADLVSRHHKIRWLFYQWTQIDYLFLTWSIYIFPNNMPTTAMHETVRSTWGL